MPAYPFQTRMVFPILLGIKPHTIRRRRAKNPTKPGDLIQMFTYWRTPRVCRFGVAPCIKVEPVILYPWTYDLLVANEGGVYRWMLQEDKEKLARQDGFESELEFFDFFRCYKQKMLDDFEIIHWDPLRVEVVAGVRMGRAVDLRPADGEASERKRLSIFYGPPEVC